MQKNLILMVLIAMISFLLGSKFQAQRDLYEGRTAKEWSNIYDDFLNIDCSKELLEPGAQISSVDVFLRCAIDVEDAKRFSERLSK